MQRRWRRRRAGPQSILSFSTADSNFLEADPHAIATPFDPNSYSLEATLTQDSRNSTRTEQRPLITVEGPEGEMIALHRLSSGSTPAALPRSRPVAPGVPPGLSGKELARLRAGALASGSQQEHHSPSTPNMSQSTSRSSLANAVAESGDEANPPVDTRRLHSEVESLRREMERLRAEGVIVEAPPSYTEGDR